MKYLKTLLGSVAMTAALALSSGAAMASTQSDGLQNHDTQLVSLGDSISYGYNLGPNNNQPSQYAFPFLLGLLQHAQVQDLAVPRATSSDLLQSLETSQQVQTAVKNADIITIDIGSNDLLSIASQDGFFTNPPSSLTPEQQLQFGTAIQTFSTNLPAILQIVHTLAPTAKIVLYNLYDPFPTQVPALHTLTEQMIGQENQIISKVAAAAYLPVADAYDLFNNHQQFLIRPNDVHPNILGQYVLAGAGELALKAESVGLTGAIIQCSTSSIQSP